MTRTIPYTSVVIGRFNNAEVRYWAADLPVEPEVLKDAIRLVGSRLTHLRRYFEKSAAVIALAGRRKPTCVSPYGFPA
jgi:hypothetical protein